jgi:hypothetical protein
VLAYALDDLPKQQHAYPNDEGPELEQGDDARGGPSWRLRAWWAPLVGCWEGARVCFAKKKEEPPLCAPSYL